MREPFRLRRGIAAGRGRDPLDVENITEALRITGFLPRPHQGAAAPSAADLDGALRRFQDREGMKVDGIAAPRRETEAELRKAIRRRAVLAARPPRTGPIRFKPLTGDSHRESRSVVGALLRRGDHRAAIANFRRALEDDPGGVVPELNQITAHLDERDPKVGARFRRDSVRMAEEVDPEAAPQIAAGRILGGTRAGTSLHSPAAFATKVGGDAQAAPAKTTAAKTRPWSEAAADMFERTVSPAPGNAPQTEFTRLARMTPEERRRQTLDAFEREFEDFIPAWRKRDMPWSARFMGYYLNGTGEPLALTREEARGFKLVRDAEAVNRQRVENSFVELMSPSNAEHTYHKKNSAPAGRGQERGPEGRQLASGLRQDFIIAEPRPGKRAGLCK